MGHRTPSPRTAVAGVLTACFLTAGVLTACGGASGATPASSPAGSSSAGSSSAGSSSAGSSVAEERNKALVLRLYSEAFNQNKADVVRELVAAGYVQHEPSVPGGADGQAEQFQNLKAKLPGAVATVKHVAADRDLVAVHWHASPDPDDEATGLARIDLYRVAAGKLVEHWGITQTVPARTASGNSLFSDEYRYENGPPKLTEEQEEASRTFAVAAYRTLSDGDATVLDRSWDPRYFQHNPAAANGTSALKQLFQQAAPTPAGTTGGSASATAAGRTQFGHSLADGDLVWIFSSDYVVADLFRVVDGKIIEHWDVVADGQ